jgi:phenylacetic acid degradation operon negative regulatory protein
MNPLLLASTRRLVARLRRERPLRSGSLIVTILGDAVAPRGGTVTLRALIRLARPFGLSERLVRTSVARIAASGLLSARRVGRRSEYLLTEQGLKRFAEATGRIYTESAASWNGSWTLVLLTTASRREREHARRELHWLGFGPWGAEVLAHPGRDPAQVRADLAAFGVSGAIVLQASSTGPAQDGLLASTGWDLTELGRRYERFIAGFDDARAAMSRAPEPTRVETAGRAAEAAFVIRTLLIHEYRKIHLRDPLLPHALLPPHWAGTAAYRLCRELYRALFQHSEQFLDTHGETLQGPLPPPNVEAQGRFGGLGGP